MKKVMLISALFILGCSDNMQRNFNFNYSINIDSTNNKKLELWAPIPQSNEVQTITNIKIDAAGLDYTIENEELHGNKYLYINHNQGTRTEKNILISFDVNRLEHQNIQYDNVEPQNYLGSYSVVPTGPFFSKIIEKNNLTESNVRGIYDYVLSGMHYGKPKEIGDTYYGDPWLSADGQYGDKAVNRDEVVGLYKKAKSHKGNYTFGNGNSVYACDIGVGNCTDYHSYFLSLSRTLEVPARFHMGFTIPEGEQGKIGGYHCWADYYEEGKGWTPVDISEADKAPEKKNYFFGTATENRVEMMVGRDFILEGYGEETVNLFIYPLLEIDDVPSTLFTKHFSYKNI
ncbi:MAG: transglutaminase domain-containing protein [Candidatus Marinimicrobia bacterium]|nr:transglutaminase domain-containing protein [Candidatus Neomarinimicrobiota bacterium]